MSYENRIKVFSWNQGDTWSTIGCGHRDVTDEAVAKALAEAGLPDHNVSVLGRTAGVAVGIELFPAIERHHAEEVTQALGRALGVTKVGFVTLPGGTNHAISERTVPIPPL